MPRTSPRVVRFQCPPGVDGDVDALAKDAEDADAFRDIKKLLVYSAKWGVCFLSDV